MAIIRDLSSFLTNIANAIRTKKGTSNKINAQDFASEIENLPSGAELNIHYGATTPSDTTKLWVKRDITPSKVSITSEINAAGAETIETLSTTLPSGLYAMGCATVGEKIYLFGGYDGSGTLDTIQMFDTTNNTLTTLNATLPEAMDYLACTAVGTKIYLFHAVDIYIFNTLTNTISTSNIKLPASVTMPTSTAVGENIYIFSSVSRKIYIYDTIANSVSTSDLKFSNMMSITSAVAVGENIYIFGVDISADVDTIQILDTTANTLTTLSAKLLYPMKSLQGEVIGTKIYLFGGSASTYFNIIQVFDTETETLSKSNKTLPTTVSRVGCATVGEKIYLFGGYDGSGTLDTINLFYIGKDLDLTSNNLLLHSKDIGTFKLFNSDTLDIEAKVGDCYYGNSSNKGEQVKIAVYKNNVWNELN